MSLKRLRQSIEESCDVLQAVLSFNYRYNPQDKAKLDEIRKRLPDATTKELEKIDQGIRREAERIAVHFGCRMTPLSFARTFIRVCRSRKGIPMFSKADIDTLYFSNFSEGDSTWREFSPHLILQVHCDWVVNPRGVIYRYHLPEATLYEDMAFAFNSAFQIDPQTDSDGNTEADIELKSRNFYLRTAVLSAFYFIEAFLNGMAFDFCHRNPNGLRQEDRALLLEEATTPNKPKFVPFEKKATQYLKIMAGTQHPPLQESNCPPLKYILNEGKELRDSIVHQSPKIHGTSGLAEKTRWMMNLDATQVTATVDAAVLLVREMNDKLGSNASPLGWLYSRTAEGVFPKEAFL